MATAQFFLYGGYIGATTDIEHGTFINDIHGPNQLGVCGVY